MPTTSSGECITNTPWTGPGGTCMWPAPRHDDPLHAGSRRKADIDAGGVLVGFTGVLVRDGYAGYDHFKDAAHAECGAHLLRALKGVHDADPAGQRWAESMTNTLLMAKKMMADAVAAGRGADSWPSPRSASSGPRTLGRSRWAGRPTPTIRGPRPRSWWSGSLGTPTRSCGSHRQRDLVFEQPASAIQTDFRPLRVMRERCSRPARMWVSSPYPQ